MRKQKDKKHKNKNIPLSVEVESESDSWSWHSVEGRELVVFSWFLWLSLFWCRGQCVFVVLSLSFEALLFFLVALQQSLGRLFFLFVALRATKGTSTRFCFFWFVFKGSVNAFSVSFFGCFGFEWVGFQPKFKGVSFWCVAWSGVGWNLSRLWSKEVPAPFSFSFFWFVAWSVVPKGRVEGLCGFLVFIFLFYGSLAFEDEILSIFWWFLDVLFGAASIWIWCPDDIWLISIEMHVPNWELNNDWLWRLQSSSHPY